MPDYIHYGNDNILDQTQNFEYYFRHSIWYIQKDKFGVKPLFDVLEAYTAWIDSYIYDDSSVRKLKALRFLRGMDKRGLNIGYCAYWTKERGCIIEWEKRPVNCKEHRCREWLEEEEAKHTNSKTICLGVLNNQLEVCN
ncbi:hypothetical protein Desaci_1603 [Desulfosporosinus acidiphilus SJ4]|uniref:Uncharacterized protein n=1 Tax=Desulfosporosinus acidiphilus (strain DSM 22704 / JCM 16185 / SJ4) TaxID=646529 RepID=I4D482_DESAJ|nr:hypothetical protein [Desulfosporosinus acidiphilus]AFM40606.1 hypothetical protein Desaci_1603 [Desulfosporosinus acidiphilus SJ4]